eukprot:CAMPEP_0170584400 /NCGR_PEP_ID=MMETSP0224-20130122/8667_1 /TAXON_ID=285029 /ORGANISM="Togula jolla, Strain CCCM 725" /LENGTH=136 /DNA_ID=CAMNT_0010907829 /DNA_START=189 /DNA_END=599 /DNA_ORIENTATION=+
MALQVLTSTLQLDMLSNSWDELVKEMPTENQDERHAREAQRIDQQPLRSMAKDANARDWGPSNVGEEANHAAALHEEDSQVAEDHRIAVEGQHVVEETDAVSTPRVWTPVDGEQFPGVRPDLDSQEDQEQNHRHRC